MDLKIENHNLAEDWSFNSKLFIVLGVMIIEWTMWSPCYKSYVYDLNLNELTSILDQLKQNNRFHIRIDSDDEESDDESEIDISFEARERVSTCCKTTGETFCQYYLTNTERRKLILEIKNFLNPFAKLL